MRRKYLYPVITAAALPLLLCGCQAMTSWFKGLTYTPPYKLYICDYSFESKDANLLNQVQYNGRTFYLKQPPLLTSSHVEAIEVFDVDGGKGLKLILDQHARHVWYQVTATHLQKKLAIMRDDNYRGWLLIEGLNNNGEVILPGPFSAAEAKEIVANAEDNYED